MVLTGVYFDDLRLGAATYDARTGKMDILFGERIDGMYHGTGDVFASALLSALLHDRSLAEATQLAVDFTVGSIARTKAANTDVRFGVNFEEGIPMLVERLGLK